MPTTFHQMNRNRKNTFTTPRDSHEAYKSYLRKVRNADSKKHSKVISQARKNRGKLVGEDHLLIRSEFPTYELYSHHIYNIEISVRFYTNIYEVKPDPRQTRNQRLCNRELLQEIGNLHPGM